MDRFISEQEAMQMLKVDKQGLSTLGVHKCPYGYSIDVLEEFIARNGLPIQEDIYHILTIGHETSRAIECPDIKRALFRANTRTRAIISNQAFDEDVYDIGAEYGIKLFYVGEECDHCHMSFASFGDAIDMAESV